MSKLSLIAAALLVAACGSKEADIPADASAPVAAEPLASPVGETAEAPPAAVDVAINDAAGASATAAAPQRLSAPPEWTLDRARSRIEFTGSQTGKNFTGSFSSFDVSISFDPENLGASRIAATIDTASAATGDRQRDDALPTPDWFASKSYPAAGFESSVIRAAGSGYEAEGILTIRGVSKGLILPFSLAIKGDRAVADGSVSLLRTDFGVGQGEFATGEWVGLDVNVTIHIEASR